MQRPSLLGTLEQLLLLAVVQAGDDAYPPRLIEVLEKSTGRAPSRGAVYVTLDRLEDKGLLESRRESPGEGRGGRPRRGLRVTEAGMLALRETRDSIASMWTGVEAAGRD